MTIDNSGIFNCISYLLLNVLKCITSYNYLESKNQPIICFFNSLKQCNFHVWVLKNLFFYNYCIFLVP